ncbi:MAG: hypothetical protein MI746_07240 [Pseudomonadales bacterium]|nr:hypothetical protein [Pseudomonadales bacterium]
MNETVVDKTGNRKLWLGGGLAAFLLTILVGFVIFSSICPCRLTPGGLLFGDRVETPVADWNTTTANQENLCQLQIWAGIRPHSINLNCMATPEGELFLSCSVCDRKYWAARVGTDEPAVLRLGDLLYPVVLNRETDPEIMDRAFRARVLKLQHTDLDTMVTPRPPLDQERFDHWWTFRVTSRT